MIRWETKGRAVDWVLLERRACRRPAPKGILARVGVIEGAVMVRTAVPVLVGVLCLGACGGGKDDEADTSAASTTARRGEPIVIHGKLIVAAKERSEPTATGTILGFHARGLGVLRRRDDPGFPCEPRSQDEAVPDRPPDHLPGRHRQDRYHAGGQRRATASDADRLVDDRERDRVIRTARRKREKRGRVRPQPPNSPVRETLTGIVTR